MNRNLGGQITVFRIIRNSLTEPQGRRFAVGQEPTVIRAMQVANATILFVDVVQG